MNYVPPILYKVKGSIGGGFPIDLLRQEQSFPADAESAAAIQRVVAADARLPAIYPNGYVEISLVSVNDRNLNRSKWRSHGWDVLQGDH